MGEIEYFEDLKVGDRAVTAGRTVTEADVVNFAGLSGDFNPIHVDKSFAETTPFKKRIAHGLLVMSIASGLFTQCEMNIRIKKSLIALLEVRARFLKPVSIGDTIHVEVKVKDKRETSKPDRGVVVLERNVINQNGEVVQVCETPYLLKRRP
ncbi:MAG: dehydratase [Deltaproteobacteria bacterium]|nr:MAG: dehydratase [Deltaproteobacteria bacterium]